MDEAIAQLLSGVVQAAFPMATFCIMAAGLCLMIGRRRWSTRLFMFAVFLIAVHVFGPGWLP